MQPWAPLATLTPVAGGSQNGVSPQLPGHRTRVVLRDAAGVLLRPLTPADRSLYLGGFDHLGPESRRLRFLGPKPTLSDAEISYFVEVDHHDHEAIVAVAGGEGLGVARYIRDEHDPRVADVAVAVVDAWQHRGVGRALLRRISERAVEEGVERLRAHVLASNGAMLAIIRRLRAATTTRSWSGGVLTVEISLDRIEVPPASS